MNLRTEARAEQLTTTYDADGHRVSMHTSRSREDDLGFSPQTTRFLIDPLAPNGFPQVIAQWDAPSEITHFLHGLGPIQEASSSNNRPSESPQYLLSDGQSSVRLSVSLLPSAEDSMVQRPLTYDAFGVQREQTEGPSHRFNGEWFDRGTGLHLLRSRSYSSVPGRFTTADTFEGYKARPSSLHKYAYAESDPINRVDPSGHESLSTISVTTSIGSSLHSLYDEAVSTTGFALTDTVKGVQAELSADAIYQEYLIGSSLGLGIGLTLSRGAGVLASLRLNRFSGSEPSVTQRLFALLGKSSYWDNAGGISAPAARELAASHGFGFEIGRFSRFENARNAVVIGRQDLIGGEVNRIMLAEEIQHGLDRATSEASHAIKRGLDNIEFHAELFQRIIQNRERGHFPFLTLEDVQGLKAIISGLQ